MTDSFPRRSGNNMRFDPYSLVLFLEQKRSDATFLTLHEVTAPHRSGAGMNAVHQRLRLAHEYDHAHRHLSTSYGLLRHAASSLLVRAVTKAFQDCPAESEMPLPMLGGIESAFRQTLIREPVLARSNQQLQDLMAQPWERGRLRYVALTELIRALDGQPPLADAHLSSWGLRVLGEAFHFQNETRHRPLSGTLCPSDHLLSFYNTPHLYCPYLDGRPLGGHAILEFFGIYREAVEHAARGLPQQTWTDFSGQGEYLRVVDYFLTKVSGYNGRNVFPIELDAVAELALWVPITPNGILAPGPALSWFDVQPGWRFLAACDYLRTHRSVWRYAEGDDFREYDEVIPIIQREVCQSLGWPTVEEIADFWLQFLKSHSTRTTLHPAWLDTGRTRLAIAMLEQRITSPFSTYFQRSNEIGGEPNGVVPALVFHDAQVLLPGSVWQGPEGYETNWWEHWQINGSRFFAEGLSANEYFQESDALGSIELLSLMTELLGGDSTTIRRQMQLFVTQPQNQQYWRWRKRKNGNAP